MTLVLYTTDFSCLWLSYGVLLALSAVRVIRVAQASLHYTRHLWDIVRRAGRTLDFGWCMLAPLRQCILSFTYTWSRPPCSVAWNYSLVLVVHCIRLAYSAIVGGTVCQYLSYTLTSGMLNGFFRFAKSHRRWWCQVCNFDYWYRFRYI